MNKRVIEGKDGPIRIGMLSLGCPKNLVDSELMLGTLEKKRFLIADQISECDVAILNTCAFIEESRQESIDYILQLAELKKDGTIKGLIVTGCLPQKYHADLSEEFKEIDALVGTGDYAEIDNIVKKIMAGHKTLAVDNVNYIYDQNAPRYALTPKHFRYVKVGEGCDHRCGFCIIPQLRGDYRSRTISDIEAETRIRVQEGAKEIILISQDTSYYGRDLEGSYQLGSLLRTLNKIEELGWIRVLYNHPYHFTDDILTGIRDSEKVCNYMDIPLQHISDSMLKSMKRGMGKADTIALMEKMRREIPGMTIRTTFIVGYPGETEKDFQELYDFMESFKFDRLGIFTYSQGDDKAAHFADQVPREIKDERKDALMLLQQKISAEKNKSMLGKTLRVLIDEKDSDSNLWLGRSYMDAPEVDGSIRVTESAGQIIKPGDFLNVVITGASEYDLTGEISK